MNYPEGLALDDQLNVLYIAEFGSHSIRMMSLNDAKYIVENLAGSKRPGTKDSTGDDAQFYHPTTLVFDKSKKLLYVADQYNHRIRAVTTKGNSDVMPDRFVSLRHYSHIDGYRDLYIHNYTVFGILAYCVMTVFAFLVTIMVRRYLLGWLRRQFQGKKLF